MIAINDAYTLLYAAAAVVGVMVAVMAWRRRVHRGGLWLAVTMLGLAEWSATCAATWQSTSEAAQVFWRRMDALGVWVIPVAVLLLALDITGMRRWMAAKYMVPLAAGFFILANVEWMNPGRLYDTSFAAVTMGSYTQYQAVPGPLYWVFVLSAFAVIGLGLAILLRHFISTSGAEREQAAILVFGGLVPFLAGAIGEARILPYTLRGLELVPLAFILTGGVWLHAIARGVLLDILPAARQALIRLMPDGVVILDRESRVVEVNPAALQALGASHAVGEPGDRVFAPLEDAASLLDGTEIVQRTGVPICRDGETGFLDISSVPLLPGDHDVLARVITLHDVTEERHTIERLELAHTVFDTVNEGVVVLEGGIASRIADVNDACCRMLRQSRDELVEADLRSFRSDRHSARFYASVDRAIETDGTWEGEIWQRRGDGSEFPSWMTFSAARDPAGERTHVVAFFADTSETKEAERLRYDATHDPLTGLANRAVLDDRLSHALAHARRVGRGLAVLFTDLDYFKSVNDTLGHSEGDLVLTEAGRRIASALRGGDTAARPGGDEFIVITDAKNPAEIEAEARRLREALAAPYQTSSGELRVTASTGIALYPDDGADVVSLVNHADLAMYGAKRLGRNRIQFFSQEMQEGLDRRVSVERELVGGLKEGRCFLLYTPQVDLHTGKIIGVEAEVNLRTRDGTVLSPTEFMPAAEYSEVIVPLGEWALRTVCAETTRIAAAAPDMFVSMSLCARQLRDVDPCMLGDVVGECGVQPRLLALGVTQTAFLGDPEEVVAKLKELQDRVGMRVMYEDFGGGHRSPAFAELLSSGVVKITHSLVELLPDDSRARALVVSTLALAKSLGATTVADGPETEEQIRFLRENDCDAAQGFRFAYPLSVEELMTQLAREPVVVIGE